MSGVDRLCHNTFDEDMPYESDRQSDMGFRPSSGTNDDVEFGFECGDAANPNGKVSDCLSVIDRG